MKVHVPALEAVEAVLDEFLLYGQTRRPSRRRAAISARADSVTRSS